MMEDNTGYSNTGNWNTGDSNAGNRNTGDSNAGNWNTGDRNTGDRNTGDSNTGDINTGNWNTGNWNTGDRNTGNFNTGYSNTGNFNTGYFNTCDHSTGVFCTEEPLMRIFNMETTIKAKEFYASDWWRAITSVPMPLTEWKYYTEEEKDKDEFKRKLGGYLQEITYKEACAIWWNKLTEKNKEIIKTIPNFDNNIFEEITGIKLG